MTNDKHSWQATKKSIWTRLRLTYLLSRKKKPFVFFQILPIRVIGYGKVHSVSELNNQSNFFPSTPYLGSENLKFIRWPENIVNKFCRVLLEKKKKSFSFSKKIPAIMANTSKLYPFFSTRFFLFIFFALAFFFFCSSFFFPLHGKRVQNSMARLK